MLRPPEGAADPRSFRPSRHEQRILAILDAISKADASLVKDASSCDCGRIFGLKGYDERSSRGAPAQSQIGLNSPPHQSLATLESASLPSRAGSAVRCQAGRHGCDVAHCGGAVSGGSSC